MEILDLISEDWLRSVGFKWHTVSGRDPDPPRDPKHWVLWMGGVSNNGFADDHDMGLELSDDRDGSWFCWLRGDISHRYSRFLHIRHIKQQSDVISLVVALSGIPWNPENHLYGKIFTSEQAARIRERDQRLDVRIAKERPWNNTEKDASASTRLISRRDEA